MTLRIVLALSAVVSGCSGGGMCEAPGCIAGSGGGDATGTGGGASVDCLTACSAKATDCGAPPGGGEQFCSGFCAKNPTASQLACLQTSGCQALMQSSPCGVGGTGGGSGSGGGSAGGGTGGAGGGSPLTCGGNTCRGATACCAQFPYCSPESSSCAPQCKPNGQACFFDSDCCNHGCDRGSNTCTSCRPAGSSCPMNNNTLACCSGACTNGVCPSCKGPGEVCGVNADCCASAYCNGGRCFRRLADGGIPN